MADLTAMGSIETSIRNKVLSAFQPAFIELENESSNHHVPPGSETHFKLILVSEKFQGVSRVDRQRRVYELLSDERAQGLHALAMWTFTPEEWAKAPQNLESPNCRGGGKG